MNTDDLALLAPTRSCLQKLLNICYDYGIKWCITYNPNKTKVMVFGRAYQSISDTTCSPLFLNGSPIDFTDECKYLGINVLAGDRFSSSSKKPLASFYGSANTILNVLHKPSERVLMHSLYANCVPKLTYACEIRSHSSREMIQMDVALNDAIRRIFTFNRWESVRFLRMEFKYPCLVRIFANRSNQFFERIPLLRNSTLSSLAAL